MFERSFTMRDSEPQLKPDILLNLLDKYVFRSKMNQKIRDEAAKLDPDKVMNRTIAMQLVQKLFEKSKSMKHLYGSPEELVHYIYQYQEFPNNAAFLGMKDVLNFDSVVFYGDYAGDSYMSKSEAFVFFFIYRIAKPKESKFVNLTAHFIGNEVGREMNSKFELVQKDFFCDTIMSDFDTILALASRIFVINSETLLRNPHFIDRVCSKFMITGRSWDQESVKNYREIFESPGFYLVEETVEEVYEIFANLFDKSKDEQCFVKLRKLIEDEHKTHPIPLNLDHFKRIYEEQLVWRGLLRIFFRSEPFRIKYPYVRLFIDDEMVKCKRFFMAKELADVLEVVMQEKFKKEFPRNLLSIENEEDRKLGISRIVEYDTFEQVLESLNLTKDDLRIVGVRLKPTDRGDIIPVNSSYGTYCKLAKHAFYVIFEQISIGMNLWKSMEKQNFPKVFEFFEKLTENDEIFGANREYRYFIDTWKIEEIIDLAYEELLKYSTTNMYVFPNKKSKNTYSENEAMKELKKFAPNFENQQKLIESYDNLIENEKRPITQKIIGFLHERAIRTAFVECHSKLNDFLNFQLNPIQIFFDVGKEDKQVERICYAKHSEIYRDFIRKMHPTISTRNFIPKENLDKMIENQMSNYEISEVFMEKDHAAFAQNSQLIFELFESKLENDVMLIRRREKPIKASDFIVNMINQDENDDNNIFEHQSTSNDQNYEEELEKENRRKNEETQEVKRVFKRHINQLLSEQSVETRRLFRRFLDNLSLNS
ncbi:unnamed protein product [Caenorhabditis angaria]|uniref:Uncharacterized protein n=1 Tax=Caenorhabditis angaria TaxID=860376 RepID=A0A9P1IL73_9PELO|nr:unnamed protein product [Caenorhabditis angaria]